jgi:hypothetical protein
LLERNWVGFDWTSSTGSAGWSAYSGSVHTCPPLQATSVAVYCVSGRSQAWQLMLVFTRGRGRRPAVTATHADPGNQKREHQGENTPPLPGGRLIGFREPDAP